ncbi:unnamed protein product [Rotaria sordida]|uniref:Uncharacterized protein n=1 Tax=Rotaria sordida TaxID=392033 RepID=A0A815I5R8_9BILA|nr:unnamed protein product [Rotaria sordida]CAF1361578.1 unnamed protein product [Rotaria sordida]CAF3586920.1 unnamed protein product [Rotaria sordida]CAF3700026.1 unnamed protein product [Rotaria sordida]
MDDFLNDHNHLQEIVCKYLTEPHPHSLIQQIDKWKRQSIIRNNEKLNENFRKQWRSKFNKLKHNLIIPKTIKICKDDDDDDDIRFISKLIVSIVEPNNLFERSAGNIRIENNSQAIIQDQ